MAKKPGLCGLLHRCEPSLRAASGLDAGARSPLPVGAAAGDDPLLEFVPVPAEAGRVGRCLRRGSEDLRL